jgi:hypothetical protein
MVRDPLPESNRDRAVAELEAELADFSHDGLVELGVHLADGRVLRGSWAGCVLSYRRGAPGSSRRDREGRARNTFTQFWDGGWITDEEVLALVRSELARRERAAPEPAAGLDGIQ